MARASVDNPAYYINRELSWLQFNRRVLEEAQDENNPLLERLKFLSISASNLDEFFEVRISGLVQQLEDGYTEAGPDGLTLLEERELVSEEVHKFVAEQYQCWNEQLRPLLGDKGIRVLGLHELDENARVFVQDYCERELASNNRWKTHSTKMGYRGYLRKWIIPRWGGYTPCNIQAGEIELLASLLAFSALKLCKDP